MKIFTSPQIRKCDAFTIKNEPVTSLALMERASAGCAGWLSQRFSTETVYHIFCGNGNNGGDGFALARLLYHKGFDVNVFMEPGKDLSPDAEINFKRTKDISGIENMKAVLFFEGFPSIFIYYIILFCQYRTFVFL